MLRLILTALLACAAMPAMATSITGSLDVYPYAGWNYPNSTITPWFGNTLATTGTGDFAPFVAGSNLVLQNPNMTIPFSALGTNSNLFCGTSCLFALVHHPNPVAWLNVSTIVDHGEFFWGTPTHQWTGTGVMSLVGFDPTPGNFTMTIQHGLFGYTDTWMSIAYNATPSPVPGPIVGAGLVPFLLGLFGINWLRRRKLKEAQPSSSVRPETSPTEARSRRAFVLDRLWAAR
jgi:hypothetical protein